MRNIVLCCDGTSNEFATDNTNVVKLYQMLDHDPTQQLCFYDPGVGTFSSPAALLPISKRITRLLGLVIGYGLMTNVEEAYAFLMNNWKPGDRIYIFGFSRGAYTARAIAGMIHRCGLLGRGQQQLVPYAAQIYRNVAKPDWKLSQQFNDTFGAKCEVHFLGLWDTVSSLGWVWSPEYLPYTTSNDSVRIVRHAIAIDEKRAFFRQNLFGTPAPGGSVKQVWFAGVHSDIGGSYPEAQSGLSQIALEWMADEAAAAGVHIDAGRRRRIFAARPPDHRGEIHESLAGVWKLFEYYPKARHMEVAGQWNTEYRPNLSQPRAINEHACLHESVLMRLRDVTGYEPVNVLKANITRNNIRDHYEVEPWPEGSSEPQLTRTDLTPYR